MVYDSDEEFKEGQLLDIEQMQFGKEVSFNFEEMCAIAYRLCIRNGCEEMRKGYWQEKTNRQGVTTKEYKEDTRLKLIESIETLKNVLIAHFDTEAKESIEILYDDIEEEEDKAKNAEHNFAVELSKQGKRFEHLAGYLNENYVFYHNLLNTKLKIYRNIFEELELLLGRLKYLKKKPVIMNAETGEIEK